MRLLIVLLLLGFAVLLALSIFLPQAAREVRPIQESEWVPPEGALFVVYPIGQRPTAENLRTIPAREFDAKRWNFYQWIAASSALPDLVKPSAAGVGPIYKRSEVNFHVIVRIREQKLSVMFSSIPKQGRVKHETYAWYFDAAGDVHNLSSGR